MACRHHPQPRKDKFFEAMVKNKQRHHGVCRMAGVAPDFGNLEPWMHTHTHESLEFHGAQMHYHIQLWACNHGPNPELDNNKVYVATCLEGIKVPTSNIFHYMMHLPDIISIKHVHRCWFVLMHQQIAQFSGRSQEL